MSDTSEQEPVYSLQEKGAITVQKLQKWHQKKLTHSLGIPVQIQQ